MIAIDTINTYKGLIEKLAEESDDSGKEIVAFGLGISHDLDQETIIHQYEDLFIKALYPIFIHNIYPKDFSNNFRTTMHNPFSYFCLLLNLSP
jgi:hypothetical protein